MQITLRKVHIRNSGMDRNDIDNILDDVCGLFRQGDFEAAKNKLDNWSSLDFDNPDLIKGYKISCFWKERNKQLGLCASELEKGDYLLEQWKTFANDFYKEYSDSDCFCENVKVFVFSEARRFFSREFGDKTIESELFFKIGLCSKIIGEYDTAIDSLEKGLKGNNSNPQIIAELADCYSLINEEKIAKLLYKEAFFIDPQKIDLDNLESLMIKKLIERVSELGYRGTELKEWLPVYGVIFQVFNINRLLKPRLINKYFWLIDYYISNNKQRSLIDEALMNINLLDPEIYNLYAN